MQRQKNPGLTPFSSGYEVDTIEQLKRAVRSQVNIQHPTILNKLASNEAMLVRNSAQRLTDPLAGVKCKASSVAKKQILVLGEWVGVAKFFIICLSLFFYIYIIRCNGI